MDDLWFNGCVLDDDGCPSAGQFLKSVEENTELKEEERQAYVMEHLSSPALEQVKSKSSASSTWKFFKKFFLDQFKSNLNLKEKIDIRRNMRQWDTELAKDFLFRCTKGHFLVCDDKAEDVLDREILISFVSGLRDEIYHQLVLDYDISDLKECLYHASKLEESDYYDNESELIPESNIKVEIDPDRCVKTENGNTEENDPIFDQYEHDDALEGLYDDNVPVTVKKEDTDYSSENDEDDDGSDYEPSYVIDSKEEKPKKKQIHKPKIYGCKECEEKFISKNKLKYHEFHTHQIPYPETKTKTIDCDKCKTVIEKAKLMKHYREFHPEISQPRGKPLVCDLCPVEKRFNYNREKNNGPLQLALHKAFKHPVKEPNPERSKFDKDYICHMCLQGFTKNVLPHHIKTVHFNEDVQPCHRCGKIFPNLAVHLRVSACARGDLICGVDGCDMSFNNKIKFKFHQKKGKLLPFLGTFLCP